MPVRSLDDACRTLSENASCLVEGDGQGLVQGLPVAARGTIERGCRRVAKLKEARGFRGIARADDGSVGSVRVGPGAPALVDRAAGFLAFAVVTNQWR